MHNTLQKPSFPFLAHWLSLCAGICLAACVQSPQAAVSTQAPHPMALSWDAAMGECAGDEPLRKAAARVDEELQRQGMALRIFCQASQGALAVADPTQSAPWPMGILRLRMPPDAPSRSALKLAEAFDMFLSAEDQQRYLHDGLRAVDLGAAPGGWTWQLLRRGLPPPARRGACQEKTHAGAAAHRDHPDGGAQPAHRSAVGQSGG